MPDPVDLDELHAPLVPLLRLVLAQVPVGNGRVALDVACGTGRKSGWLAEGLPPEGRVIGIDRDVAALSVAQQHNPGRPFVWLAGDAQALPLGADVADLAWCVAALGLFADADLALRELRRVLRPGGTVIVATGAQLWVRARHWPPDLAALLAAAYAQAPAAASSPVPPADDLGVDRTAQLTRAGFAGVTVRAFLPTTPFADASPPAAELALTDWSVLRTRVAPWLSSAELERCDAFATTEPEPEIATVLLVGIAMKS
ncbi:MAG: class I SAM-dependent methyltransferase [Chloroflexaceae bacterium]